MFWTKKQSSKNLQKTCRQLSLKIIMNDDDAHVDADPSKTSGETFL